jgi:hypothetical protein
LEGTFQLAIAVPCKSATVSIFPDVCGTSNKPLSTASGSPGVPSKYLGSNSESRFVPIHVE